MTVNKPAKRGRPRKVGKKLGSGKYSEHLHIRVSKQQKLNLKRAAVKTEKGTISKYIQYIADCKIEVNE